MKKGISTGRERTKYPGVFTRKNEDGETVFYIRYRRGGRGAKEICEPVGKASSGMTAAKYTSYKFADEKEYFVAYGKLIMHTGIRRSAAIALRWDDCDFEKGFITLRGETAKSKKTQRIPMSPFVHDLLFSLPHGNGEFIFPQRHFDT